MDIYMEISENIQYIESCTIQMENYTIIIKKIHVQYKLKKNIHSADEKVINTNG